MTFSEEMMTLSRLLDALSPHFHELQVLDKIFVGGIAANCHATNESLKASCLLAEIFDTLNDLNGLGDDSHALVLCSFFVESFSVEPCTQMQETNF